MKPITMYSAVGTHSTAQHSTKSNRVQHTVKANPMREILHYSNRSSQEVERKKNTHKTKQQRKKRSILKICTIYCEWARARLTVVCIYIFFHYSCTECISIPSLVVYIKSCARIQMQTHRTHLPKTSIT